jgi:hypothetical protein
MIIFILILVLAILSTLIVLELISWSVYGWFADESELDSFFGKHFADYELNSIRL